MAEALASKTLVELPFFSSQPDSRTHRACDNRKCLRAAHAQTRRTKFDDHLPVMAGDDPRPDLPLRVLFEDG